MHKNIDRTLSNKNKEKKRLIKYVNIFLKKTTTKKQKHQYACE